MSHVHSVVKLQGTTNYDAWALKTKMLLIREGLWSVIEPPVTKTPEAKEEETEAKGALVVDPDKDQKALATIVLAMDDSLLDHASGATTARELWKTLKDLYSMKGFTAKYLLLKGLMSTTLSSSPSAEEFARSIKRFNQRLLNMGAKVENWVLVAVLLHNLGQPYDGFVSSTLQNVRDKEPDLDTVIAQLLDEERRRGSTETTTALYSKRRNKQATGKTCTHCKKAGHVRNDCWSLHPNKKPQGGQGRSNQRENDNKKAKPGGSSLMATSRRLGAGTTWYVDSCASEHMCSDRAVFTSLVRGSSTILLGDNSTLAVEGVGEVRMSWKRSNRKPFDANVTNVHFVPSLKTNLLSVSALLKKGCEVRFDQNGCHIYRDGEVIGLGKPEGDLFRLELASTTYALAAGQIEQVKPLEVWHRRFGHLGVTDVRKLESVTTGMQIQRGTAMTGVCGPCTQGK